MSYKWPRVCEHPFLINGLFQAIYLNATPYSDILEICVFLTLWQRFEEGAFSAPV